MLRIKSVLPFVAFAFASLPIAATAAPLTVVNTNAPAVNCVFRTNCTLPVIDTIGNFSIPQDNGMARLQSRTYTGTAPAPLAGKMGYDYRVDLTGVSGVLASNCVTKMQILFGPITKGPYPPGAALKDIFVVTSGGLGSVGIASAEQTGGLVTVTFGGSGVCPGQTSYFFGLASTITTPVSGMAKLYFSLGGSTTTPARIP
jgi:hypothetical protein